jgi:hypothetical protein|tara:strand:+ start:920 stop:1306 length:387 start_codon:yes stop_codon:yes gene_type:complete
MYDPNMDAEERMRKLAMQELMVNNKDMMAGVDMTPTIPQPEIAVAPPEMPDTNMMDQMQAALANYQGMAPINPIVGDVTRGGQQIQPIGSQLVSGAGLNTAGLLDSVGEDDDKKAKMAEMIMKIMGGG